MNTATIATGVQDWPGGRLGIKRGSGAEQLDVDEMEIASPTAKQWWAYARAWLAVEMRANPPG